MTGPRTEPTKAILAFIQQHGPVLHSALADQFRPQAAAVGTSATRWLSSRLQNLANSGFIALGPDGWAAAEGVRTPVARAKPEQRECEELNELQVAQPRRVGMFGPVYRPAPTMHRAGANDHAAYPSLINGAPRPYWSEQ